MLSLILADARLASLWDSLGEPAPAPDLFKDRIKTKKTCQKLISLLVEKALGKTFSLSPGDYTLLKKSSGAPYLAPSQPETKTPFISLSHSGPFVGIALSNEEAVGIDIEDSNLKRRLDKVATCFSDEEQKLFRKKGAAGFYQVWTGREALGKWNEKGLEAALSLAVSSWPSLIESWQAADVFFDPPSLEKKPFSLFFSQKESVFLSCAVAEGAFTPKTFTFVTIL